MGCSSTCIHRNGLPPHRRLDAAATFLCAATLVCKSCCRLISSQRFHEFHRAATPMLGFLCNVLDKQGGVVPTSSCPPITDRHGFALDRRPPWSCAPRENPPFFIEYEHAVRVGQPEHRHRRTSRHTRPDERVRVRPHYRRCPPVPARQELPKYSAGSSGRSRPRQLTVAWNAAA
jgi:hypothetical protein